MKCVPVPGGRAGSLTREISPRSWRGGQERSGRRGTCRCHRTIAAPTGEKGSGNVLAIVRSSALFGVQSVPVQVEVDLSPGLPTFDIVGLPGTAVREARNRVRSALRHAGFTFPLGRVTVNLAPADFPKGGTLFDLPIALGILQASGQAPPSDRLAHWVVVGELSLDGRLRPVHGALCIAAMVKSTGQTLVLPSANRTEVDAIPGIQVIAASTLKEIVAAAFAGARGEATQGRSVSGDARPAFEGWRSIQGQAAAKRALEIAAAGGHHVMLVGPPGAGKTALARAVEEIAPMLTPEESVEVSSIYSAAGLLDEERPLIDRRPFRSPHPSVTEAALLGGGRTPRPGEVSLAHKGFLFLDEFPEFHVRVLEGLRGPLEEGAVVLSRAEGKCRLPAEFTLLATANPCPCGYFGDPARPCTCLPAQRRRYERRLTGPLIDRIDLFVHVARPDAGSVVGGLGGTQEALPFEERVRERVEEAVRRQAARYRIRGRRNRDLRPSELGNFAALDERGRGFLHKAAQSWHLSARSLHRVVRVARTIADLEGEERIRAEHVAEALSYRKEACFPPGV